VATITARATQNLSRYNLDFVGLTVRSITVNGRRARWSREGGELRITPARGIRDRTRFVTVVRYDGVPETLEEFGGLSGFIHTHDGALVVGQPHVADTWFPVNDHPSDTASYTFRITVPKGLEAVANGILVRRRTGSGWTTWRWRASDPMASYLAGMGIGEFDLSAYRHGRIRFWDAIDPVLFEPPPCPGPATSSPYRNRPAPRTSGFPVASACRRAARSCPFGSHAIPSPGGTSSS
jgi:aminopeptidase N